MTREKHKLSGYFLLLEEKSNKYNNYAVCQDCIRGLGREKAMKQRFTNTKRACVKHIENYSYWIERYSSEETQAIIQKAMETSDNIEFARLENDEKIFILSDNEGSDTYSKMGENDNESINNIYIQPLTSAKEWRKTVIDWIEMIKNESQDQDNELLSGYLEDFIIGKA
ncbi:15911_t:CDS:2 [Funneliformis geosporum]|nr:15911_t:CDS:2 [Funneliformis geosporum]